MLSDEKINPTSVYSTFDCAAVQIQIKTLTEKANLAVLPYLALKEL